jgi:hypothetical protein
MEPWSVTATAGIPWRRASEKIVGEDGSEDGGSIRAAPSSSEYSEWTWRWTKPGPLLSCSDLLRAGVIHSDPGGCGQLTVV